MLSIKLCFNDNSSTTFIREYDGVDAFNKILKMARIIAKDQDSAAFISVGIDEYTISEEMFNDKEQPLCKIGPNGNIEWCVENKTS